MARLPKTQAEVFYSYQITIDGLTVGTLKEFSPSQTRSHDHVREISTNGGEIVEIVPGVPTYSLNLSKVRLYENTIFTAFGVDSQDIQNQIRSINIIETVFLPTTSEEERTPGVTGLPSSEQGMGKTGRVVTYEDCWITDWGKQVSSDGILIVENMTVQCTRVLS